MTYFHSQYMEGAGWWGQWWEDRKNGRRVTESATGAEIRYTENQDDRAGQKEVANVM